MSYGVQDGVYFTECDGSQMRLLWKVFQFPHLSSDFVADVRMRVRDAEYGVSFRHLDDQQQRIHWSWWANITGAGRWKLEQVVTSLDSSTGGAPSPDVRTVAEGTSDGAPWLPDD
ncbi:MAG: hypothetical protein WD070_11525, partial [Pirellulaceae bacterium]